MKKVVFFELLVMVGIFWFFNFSGKENRSLSSTARGAELEQFPTPLDLRLSPERSFVVSCFSPSGERGINKRIRCWLPGLSVPKSPISVKKNGHEKD